MKRRRMQANASARRCTTVALSVLLAPQVPGLVFRLFYKRLALPSLSGEGLLQRAPEGVPEVIFGVIFEVIFGVILDTIGAIKSRLRLYNA